MKHFLPFLSLLFVLAVSLAVPIFILGGSLTLPITVPDLIYVLGKYFALSAFFVLTFQYIWTAKFKFLERIRSYDQRVAAHRTLGIFGILTVALHPILILVFYATQGVPLTVDLPMAAGFLSIIILLFVLASTFLGRIWNVRYETWKRLHWFTFPVLTAAFYHSIKLGSDMYGPVRITWFVLWGLHLAVVIGKIIHKARFWSKTSKVISVESHSPGTVTVVAERPAENYLPGQFGFFTAKLGKRWEGWHPFSLTSHHADEHISVTVKGLGDFSSGLGSIEAGDPIKTDLGYGRFTPHVAPDSRYVFIAAGVGITPIFAIIQDLIKTDSNAEAVLLYCVHSEPDVLYRRELEEWFGNRPNWSLNITCTSQPDWGGLKGRINNAMVDQVVGGEYSGTFFLCGPSMMTQSVASYLRKMRVKRRHIKREQFVFLP